MTKNDLIFLFELLMSQVELGLFQELQENPKDESTKKTYIDWLIDRGRNMSADLLKSNYVPIIGYPISNSVYSGGAIDFQFSDLYSSGLVSDSVIVPQLTGSVRGYIHD